MYWLSFYAKHEPLTRMLITLKLTLIVNYLSHDLKSIDLNLLTILLILKKHQINPTIVSHQINLSQPVMSSNQLVNLINNHQINPLTKSGQNLKI